MEEVGGGLVALDVALDELAGRDDAQTPLTDRVERSLGQAAADALALVGVAHLRVVHVDGIAVDAVLDEAGDLAVDQRLVAALGGVVGDGHIDGIGHAPSVPLSSRSEEHTSELQSLMRISYAVFCLKKKNK